jgi:bifunctional UDP-N-acetylglucosamine pyrophosphorylase/glucosamine-1-phosphate N-acetyltransferase
MYGRLIMNDAGYLQKIVEFADAGPKERAAPLLNSGVMAIDGSVLFDLLDKVTDHNAKKEFYLTDIIQIAGDRGMRCVVCETNAQEVLGVNSRKDLALVESAVQQRLRDKAMLEGVTLIDPDSVFLCADTRFGKDVVVHPFVVFGEDVIIGDRSIVYSFSHISKTKTGAACKIGPHARLERGVELDDKVELGNFVQVKKSRIGDGTKAKHLTYIGDSQIGKKVNVGAGVITCNYNGVRKFPTVIGDNAFLGSNTTYVAPVTVEADTIIAAGSVITENVPRDALGIARERQCTKLGFVKKFMDQERQLKEKEGK